VELALGLLALTGAVTAVSSLAGRFSVSSPLLLVLVGIAASFPS